MKSRAAVVASIAFVALASVVASAPASAEVAPPGVCPDMFFPITSAAAPQGTDRNANGIVCAKVADGQVLFVDDVFAM